MLALYIILGILVILILWVIAAYNGLIKAGTRTDEALSDIDVQLKRRHDLIPNLIETVKGYAGHEEKIFKDVTEARAKAISAKGPEEKAQAENALSGTLKTLFAVTENYPNLKANENFIELQRELSDTENKIQAARRFYNGNVKGLNIKIQTFPSNIIAGMFSFKKREFFMMEESEKDVPAVKF